MMSGTQASTSTPCTAALAIKITHSISYLQTSSGHELPNSRNRQGSLVSCDEEYSDIMPCDCHDEIVPLPGTGRPLTDVLSVVCRCVGGATYHDCVRRDSAIMKFKMCELFKRMGRFAATSGCNAQSDKLYFPGRMVAHRRYLGNSTS